MNKLSYVVLAYLLLNINWANAEQLSFDKIDVGDSYQFNYQWQDINNKVQQLSFSLAKQDIFSPFRHFKQYKPEFAARYVKSKLKQSLDKEPIKDVSLNFDTHSDSVNLQSRHPEALNKAQQRIEQEEHQYFKEYLDAHYYQEFTDHSLAQGVKPNHIRIAQESVSLFEPTKDIILDIVNFKNIRLVTNYVLGFVQSIPYAQLESRLTSSGAGFNVPAKVIWENQGDCDSKMTLTVAMLRALMPRIKMAMVYIDQHAFIGIDVLPEGDDINITHEGRHFVLADPTGPAQLLLGDLSFDNQQAIFANHYTIEIFD